MFCRGVQFREGGPNPLADMDRGGPNPLANLYRGVQIRCDTGIISAATYVSKRKRMEKKTNKQTSKYARFPFVFPRKD